MNKEEILHHVDMCLSNGVLTDKFHGCFCIRDEMIFALGLLTSYFNEKNMYDVSLSIDDEGMRLDIDVNKEKIHTITGGDFAKWKSSLSLSDIREFIIGESTKPYFIDNLRKWDDEGLLMYGAYGWITAHLHGWRYDKYRHGEIYISMCSKTMKSISIMYDGDCLKITKEEVIAWIK